VRTSTSPQKLKKYHISIDWGSGQSQPVRVHGGVGRSYGCPRAVDGDGLKAFLLILWSGGISYVRHSLAEWRVGFSFLVYTISKNALAESLSRKT
jgi:hypothetical protein